MDDWQRLYDAARKAQTVRTVSPFIEVGEVAAALLTKNGNIFFGICIDTACGLGMCAERNAIANMLTHGENEIDKILAVTSDGSIGSGNILILTDYENRKTVTLKDLTPDWWGASRFD